MKKNEGKTTIRPLGFCSILFFSLALSCVIFPLLQNAVLLTRHIKDFHSLLQISFSTFFTFLIAFLAGFVFLFPVLGQKVVVQDKKMSVYLWGKNKWTFDLSVLHEAELGFYYQNKFEKLLHYNRKYLSIQVKTGRSKACFPVDFYSTKQIRKIVFTLNNSLADKFKDWRLNGQEKYLMNAHLVPAMPPKEKQKHCEFCKESLGLGGNLEKGYATKSRKYWICEKCLEDFKDMFKFRLIKNTKNDRIKK